MSEPDEPLRFERHNEGLEFDRLTFFNDAVFAIAMTLLIVSVAVPTLHRASSSSDLLDALGDQLASFVAFFIGFAVLGNYWVANHRFTHALGAVDGGYIRLTLLYLAFVAWLPFPTALLGEYHTNPAAVGLFAISAAVVSGCEALLLVRAHRHHLLVKPLPPEGFRYALTASLLPVASFVVSVPIAFASTGLAIVCWFAAVPVQVLLDRRQSAVAKDGRLFG